MKAREIMTPNPEVVTQEDAVSRAAQLMRDLDVGIIPVVDDRDGMHLQGVITDRDITVRCVANGGSGNGSKVRDCMTDQGLVTADPDHDVEQVLSRMKEDQVRRVPVVEPDRRVVGIIAQADLAMKFGDQEPEKIEELLEDISEPGQPQR